MADQEVACRQTRLKSRKTPVKEREEEEGGAILQTVQPVLSAAQPLNHAAQTSAGPETKPAPFSPAMVWNDQHIFPVKPTSPPFPIALCPLRCSQHGLAQ